jgi:thioesterase domain-containing protein
MLVTIQTKGARPPLFFVHGYYGVMPIGRTLADTLGPDQPLYAIEAGGDGRRAPLDTVPGMATAYAAEIQQVYPSGPLFIGGMCTGGLIAIEVARKLLTTGRLSGPVILLDPPSIPVSKARVWIDPAPIAQLLYDQTRKNLLAYAANPENDLSFDVHDPQQLHAAILAGSASIVATGRHVPTPYTGAVELIVNGALAVRFFHPEMHWVKLLAGPYRVHVLSGTHSDLFQVRRQDVARQIRFVVEESSLADIALQPAASAT